MFSPFVRKMPLSFSGWLLLATVGVAILSACASSGARSVSSAKVATPAGGWAKWAETNAGIKPQNLSASVAFAPEGPRSVGIYFARRSMGKVGLTEQGVLERGLSNVAGTPRAFLELLAVYALFEAGPRLDRIYVGTDDSPEDVVPGLGVGAFVRGTAQVNGSKYGLLKRESFVIPADLRELFQRMIAPVPVLPGTKQRLNFAGDFDPAEEFRKAGLSPESIEIVVTEEGGEEPGYSVDFFQDRYFLGGLSFARHPERWEDYSGIPSTHLHGRGLGTLFYILAAFQLKDFSKKPLVSDGNRSGQAEAVWENLVAAGWAKKSLPRGSGGVATYRFNMEALKDAKGMKNFSSRRTLLKDDGGRG